MCIPLAAGMVVLVAAGGVARAQQPPPDQVLFNGKIITVDERFTIAQAVAITGDHIVAVGANQAMAQLALPRSGYARSDRTVRRARPGGPEYAFVPDPGKLVRAAGQRTGAFLELRRGARGSIVGISRCLAGRTIPASSGLNDPTGAVLSNAVIVPAGANGDVSVFATDATDLVIDIDGYFAPQGPGGLSLYMVTPCRVLDSRLPTGTPPFSSTRYVSVTGTACGVPATAQAFVCSTRPWFRRDF